MVIIVGSVRVNCIYDVFNDVISKEHLEVLLLTVYVIHTLWPLVTSTCVSWCPQEDFGASFAADYNQCIWISEKTLLEFS